jgi:hypothetical protein
LELPQAQAGAREDPRSSWNAGLDLSCCTIADVATEEEAAATAVRLFRDRKAQSLMKGSA